MINGCLRFPRNITHVCSHPVAGQESGQHPEAENLRQTFIPLNTSFYYYRFT